MSAPKLIIGRRADPLRQHTPRTMVAAFGPGARLHKPAPRNPERMVGAVMAMCVVALVVFWAKGWL